MNEWTNCPKDGSSFGIIYRWIISNNNQAQLVTLSCCSPPDIEFKFCPNCGEKLKELE